MPQPREGEQSVWNPVLQVSMAASLQRRLPPAELLRSAKPSADSAEKAGPLIWEQEADRTRSARSLLISTVLHLLAR